MAGINTLVAAIESVLVTVPGVGTVYTYTPIGPIIPDEFPYIVITDHRQGEHRQGTPYRAGTKWVHHTIMLETHNETQQPDVDQPDFQVFLDAIRSKLRYDPSLNGVTLRFGEDIDVDWTITAAAGTMIYDATITSEAVEEIHA